MSWLVIVLLSGAVFLTSFVGRRIYGQRRRARRVGTNARLPRVALAPPAFATRLSPTRNGKPNAKPTANGADPDETFEIGWARGYFESDFYLATSASGGEVSEVGRSPGFRWTAANDPPPAEAITRAHARLVQRLELMGWEEVGRGESWYAHRYRRTVPRDPANQVSRGRTQLQVE